MRRFMPGRGDGALGHGLRGIVVIEGAGHWLQQERPDEVNERAAGVPGGGGPTMKIGVDIYPTIDVPPPDELARMVEARGFESLLFPEHTHVPADGSSLYPGTGGPHARMLDPFVALTAAAAASERLKIGTGICLVIARDPIITANQVASLDLLSGGRFLFGVGGGWNRKEMENHGTDFDRRFSVMRERIEAMKAIWTQDEASYQASASRSARCGRGRSRCSGPTRRSWSAAWARACSTACSPTATAGTRTRSTTSTACSAASPSCAAVPRRPIAP